MPEGVLLVRRPGRERERPQRRDRRHQVYHRLRRVREQPHRPRQQVSPELEPDVTTAATRAPRVEPGGPSDPRQGPPPKETAAIEATNPAPALPRPGRPTETHERALIPTTRPGPEHAPNPPTTENLRVTLNQTVTVPVGRTRSRIPRISPIFLRNMRFSRAFVCGVSSRRSRKAPACRRRLRRVYDL